MLVERDLMSKINLEYFTRCMNTLEKAFSSLAKFSTEDELYDIYRAACVKEFELIINANKLLKAMFSPRNPKKAPNFRIIIGKLG